MPAGPVSAVAGARRPLCGYIGAGARAEQPAVAAAAPSTPPPAAAGSHRGVASIAAPSALRSPPSDRRRSQARNDRAEGSAQASRSRTRTRSHSSAGPLCCADTAAAWRALSRTTLIALIPASASEWEHRLHVPRGCASPVKASPSVSQQRWAVAAAAAAAAAAARQQWWLAVS